MSPHGHKPPVPPDLAALWRGSGGGGEGAKRSRPIIGIAPDVVEPRPGSVRATCALTYAGAIHAAGGWPIILPPIVEMIPLHLERCDGFVLTGGDDPRTEPFGVPTHPKATPVHELRQAFDSALLRALMQRPQTPTLGVCLGMQMMALVAGGSLDQHLPETLATAERHWGDARHAIKPVGRTGPVGAMLAQSGGAVTSHHRQAVREAGSLRVAAVSDDGVIEAIERADAPFFVGVQWHPERTGDGSLGTGVFEGLVRAARAGGK
jgi:gamma-glutamyl-gamma-aminobutyrate hydrolase PuuD